MSKNSPQETYDNFKVNVFGHISVTQAILPIMKKQKSGQVYMMSSVAAMAGMSPFAAYNSSKAALEGAWLVHLCANEESVDGAL